MAQNREITGKLKTETVPLQSLSLDPANVRKHGQRNIESIQASLRRFGQQHPIIATRAGVVLAGNGRVQAMRDMGWQDCEVVYTDLQGADATAFAIADNRTAELAEWDDDALKQTLASLQNDEGYDHLVTGFTDAEIGELLGDVEADSDVDVPSIYQVIVICEDEHQQQRVYEIMEREGVQCRLSTL